MSVVAILCPQCNILSTNWIEWEGQDICTHCMSKMERERAAQEYQDFMQKRADEQSEPQARKPATHWHKSLIAFEELMEDIGIFVDHMRISGICLDNGEDRKRFMTLLKGHLKHTTFFMDRGKI